MLERANSLSGIIVVQYGKVDLKQPVGLAMLEVELGSTDTFGI